MDNIFDKFIEIRPIVVEGEPDAHSVYFKVGVQSFCISPHSCDNKEHAEWFAGMFKKALATMFQEFNTLSAPQVVEGELLPCPFCGSPCDDVRREDGEGYLGCSDKKCPAYKLAMSDQEWNTRPTAQGELVGALLKACKRALPILAGAVSQNCGNSREFGGDFSDRLAHDAVEDAITLAEKAALSASPVAGWIAVSERLPEPHQDVWCLNRDGWQFQGRVCYGMHKPFFTYPRGDGNASNTAPKWIDVSHWMPLPSPPQPSAAEVVVPLGAQST